MEYGIRFLVGGMFVPLFALIAQVCKPKQFAGIFAAASSILLAGLIITLSTQGVAHAILTVEGAIAGAVGMIVYCLVANPAIQRYQSLVGSLLALGCWLAMADATFAMLHLLFD